MGARHSNKVGHDQITRENNTHVEVNTRHVYAKTSGFRLFDIHEEGSGGASSGIVAGVSGIGIMGEIAILIAVLWLGLWLVRKCHERQARHEGYKACYRSQVGRAEILPRFHPTLMHSEWQGQQQSKSDKKDTQLNQEGPDISIDSE